MFVVVLFVELEMTKGKTKGEKENGRKAKQRA